MSEPHDPYNLYSLLTTIEQNWHLGYLGHAGDTAGGVVPPSWPPGATPEARTNPRLLHGCAGAAEGESVWHRRVGEVGVDGTGCGVSFLVAGAKLDESVVERPGDLSGLK